MPTQQSLTLSRNRNAPWDRSCQFYCIKVWNGDKRTQTNILPSPRYSRNEIINSLNLFLMDTLKAPVKRSALINKIKLRFGTQGSPQNRDEYYKKLEDVSEPPEDTEIGEDVEDTTEIKSTYSLIDYKDHPYQFPKTLTPLLHTSVNRNGHGCSRLKNKTLKTYSEVDELLEMKKEINSNIESDDEFRPKQKLGKLKIFDGNFWLNWWFHDANRNIKNKLIKTRHF